jgi:hypothetical protein
MAAIFVICVIAIFIILVLQFVAETRVFSTLRKLMQRVCTICMYVSDEVALQTRLRTRVLLPFRKFIAASR